MTAHPAEFDYVTGQMRDSFGPLLADFEQFNAQALDQGGWELDLPYGTHPRQRFDLRPTDSPARGTVIYFHAGYWQSRDKAQFRFLAPGFNALGWHAALVNYPLCPEVGVPQIVESAAEAFKQVLRHQALRGRGGPVVLCGHSAGAHLVVELALQQARQAQDIHLPLAGVLPVSGIFDLAPLVGTSLNQRLQLDGDQARACSPLHRAGPNAAPALFLVGETETAAFHSQTQHMHQAWQAQGNPSAWQAVPGADHFSILETLCAPHGRVDQALQAWARG